MRTIGFVILFFALFSTTLTAQNTPPPCNAQQSKDLLEQIEEHGPTSILPNEKFIDCVDGRTLQTRNLPPYFEKYVFLTDFVNNKSHTMLVFFETNNGGVSVADVFLLYTYTCENNGGTLQCSTDQFDIAVNESYQNSGYGTRNANWNTLLGPTNQKMRRMSQIVYEATKKRTNP